MVVVALRGGSDVARHSTNCTIIYRLPSASSMVLLYCMQRYMLIVLSSVLVYLTAVKAIKLTNVLFIPRSLSPCHLEKRGEEF